MEIIKREMNILLDLFEKVFEMVRGISPIVQLSKAILLWPPKKGQSTDLEIVQKNKSTLIHVLLLFPKTESV